MTKIPHADEGTICPFHREDMSKVCHKCPLWTRVMGKHPQSEEMMDDWRCALAWLPVLMIENSQQQRQTTAAMESLRNGVAEAVTEAIGITAQTTERRLLNAAGFNSHRG